MNPKRHNLSIYKGSTYQQGFKFTQNGDIYPLTGYTAKAEIKPTAKSNVLTSSFTCTVSPAEGLITITLTAEQTAAIAVGNYEWDLKTTDGDGVVRYFLFGNVEVWGRVTV